jgi:hypothetical protein
MDNLSITLTSAKCELLDNILKEFKDESYIKTDRVSKIFRGNDILAADYLGLLSQLQLITLIGEVEGYALPAMIGKQSGVKMFMSEGGFMRRFELKQLQETAGKGVQELQTENLNLSSANRTHKEKIEKMEGALRQYQEQIELFKQAKFNEIFIRIGLFLLGVALTWLIITFI